VFHTHVCKCIACWATSEKRSVLWLNKAFCPLLFSVHYYLFYSNFSGASFKTAVYLIHKRLVQRWIYSTGSTVLQKIVAIGKRTIWRRSICCGTNPKLWFLISQCDQNRKCERNVISNFMTSIYILSISASGLWTLAQCAAALSEVKNNCSVNKVFTNHLIINNFSLSCFICRRRSALLQLHTQQRRRNFWHWMRRTKCSTSSSSHMSIQNYKLWKSAGHPNKYSFFVF